MSDTSTALAALPADLRDAHDILASGAAQILPADGLAERLSAARREDRPLRVKLGIDPSGTDLTLGHAVVLRKLRQFQDLGHTAVLVVGGFTGQVGDPSGRTATRAAQSADDVVANARGYFDQVMRILDRDRTEVVNNADWLGVMSLADILGYTRQVTVAQLLERDDFARRFGANQPISLSEFVYPLLQGIDSVEIRADIELGGTDQTFNNLVGRELQRSRGQAPQAVLTVPLLVGTDGVEKMGKSLGNYVAIAEPAAEQFGKLMSVPDEVVGTYARLCTDLHPRDVDELAAEVAAGGAGANRAKRRMAREVVALYHGVEEAAAAEQRFDAVFRRHEVPRDVPEHALGADDPAHLPAVLVAAGLAASSSEARRAVDAGAVKIDGTPVPKRGYDLARAELVGRVLTNGKRRAARLI
ncbi:tyrosyl-tRNA synthetase [Jatrophihabitans endophyticus]|uniref:Tyrosine--tRNA ligase n=1 Tax=Jatrophihabitans endophyticus TaxID=1206085 RepID=A0A1M5MNC8_9ACTN|nr:tyrosine--tRNA ligase [Jatrophihabitans endophyticus]SHG78771.1 tyrosyl-tRNA synthetase [Jatrophihabitans endophyticus]